MEKEVFKIYKTAYKGKRIYEVSNLGRVRVNGKIVEPHMNNKYLCIGTIRIHRAVAELFVPNPENKPFVDHINTDRLDNRAENLRWVTNKENCNNPLTRKHNSETHKGKTHSEESKRKMSEAQKGRLFSEEHKAKLRSAKRARHWKLVDGKRIWYD